MNGYSTFLHTIAPGKYTVINVEYGLPMFIVQGRALLCFQRKMRIVVNKHWRVYLDFGRAGSLNLLLQITAYVHGNEKSRFTYTYCTCL